MHENQGQGADGHGRELLTFSQGNEEYGIDIFNVQETCGYDAVTTLIDSAERWLPSTSPHWAPWMIA